MKGEKKMTVIEYLANELAVIGVRFMPESREHRVIESVIEILMDRQDQKEDPLN